VRLNFDPLHYINVIPIPTHTIAVNILKTAFRSSTTENAPLSAEFVGEAVSELLPEATTRLVVLEVVPVLVGECEPEAENQVSAK